MVPRAKAIFIGHLPSGKEDESTLSVGGFDLWSRRSNRVAQYRHSLAAIHHTNDTFHGFDRLNAVSEFEPVGFRRLRLIAHGLVALVPHRDVQVLLAQRMQHTQRHPIEHLHRIVVAIRRWYR